MLRLWLKKINIINIPGGIMDWGKIKASAIYFLIFIGGTWLAFRIIKKYGIILILLAGLGYLGLKLIDYLSTTKECQ